MRSRAVWWGTFWGSFLLINAMNWKTRLQLPRKLFSLRFPMGLRLLPMPTIQGKATDGSVRSLPTFNYF